MSRKRAHEENDEDKKQSRKKARTMSQEKEQIEDDIDLNVTIDDTWISASKTRNYALRDPLLDWLNVYGERKGYFPDNKKTTSLSKSLNFTEFLLNKGHEFEEYIMKDHLFPRFGDKIVDLKSIDDLWGKIRGKNNLGISKEEKYSFQLKETYKLMKEGTPIIYQGLVFNPENKTFGYPDLIVRSDYLNKISVCSSITEEKIKKGCRFSDRWHYRIVDIKYTKLKVKVDGKHLNKNSTIEAYKSQLYIYNRAIGYMQNLVPGKAYLLGRGWESTKGKSTDPLDKLVRVDFFGDDIETKENTEAAIEWLSDLKENGHSWKILPKPTKDELYPNMGNDMDYPWHGVKKILAEELKEITQISHCGVDHREYIHSKKIYGWDNKNCNSLNLGLTGKIIPVIVDAILDINKSKNIYKYDKSATTKVDWRPTINSLNLFFDFETVSDIKDVKKSGSGNDIVFMTGMGYMKKENDKEEWNYESYITDILDQESEEKSFKQFLNSVKGLIKDKKVCKLYHFSSAEPNVFKKLVEKYDINVSFEIIWVDLLKVMKDYMFVINGCFDFSLKSIVGSLSNHKLIKTDYSSSEIVSGSQAMVGAFLADEEIRKNRELDFIAVNVPTMMKHLEVMKLIEKYNQVDCKTLMELTNFLDTSIKKGNKD